jgi:hypothetical protein
MSEIQNNEEITETVLKQLISEAVENNQISVIEESDLPENGYKKVRFREPLTSLLVPKLPDSSLHHPSTSSAGKPKVSPKLEIIKYKRTRNLPTARNANSKPTRQARQPKQRPQLPGQTRITDYYKLYREATL